MTIDLHYRTTVLKEEVTADVDLVAMMRVQNSKAAEEHYCWSLMTDEASLVVGVAGNLGVLAWYGPGAVDDMEVSAQGSNAEPIDYRLGGLYPQPFPAHCEISVEDVYAAVREFLVTSQKPRCVTWQPEEAAWVASG
ncbi:MAG TPA: Imm1 family immunity protein [Pseudonocardiaceae bacterium]|nr:Imm1 family immunity protein [Pseudonocardiaceae bacterium]